MDSERRRYLQTLAGATATLAAGCLGGEPGGPTDTGPRAAACFGRRHRAVPDHTF